MSDHKNNSKENEQGAVEEVSKDKSKTPEIAVNQENSNECDNSSGKDNNAEPFVYRRFKFLKHALEKVIAKCSSAGKFGWYKTHFPVLYTKKPTKLRHIQEQVIQQLRENIKSETEMMLDEENIEKMMNELDILIYNSSINSVVWRPTGNVNDDVRAHLMLEKRKYRENLRELLKNLEEENKQLKDLVVQRHLNVHKTKEKLVLSTSFFTEAQNTANSIQMPFA